MCALVRKVVQLVVNDGSKASDEVLEFDGRPFPKQIYQEVESNPTLRASLQADPRGRILPVNLPCQRMLEVGFGMKHRPVDGEAVENAGNVEHGLTLRQAGVGRPAAGDPLSPPGTESEGALEPGLLTDLLTDGA